MIKLSRDVNGNKIVTYKPNEGRGFSIQTLGNMPQTHRMTKADFDESIALNELNGYIEIYGTKRQKELLG